MADGFNQFRALRVAEVMNEFRTLQHQISQTYANPDPDEYYEIGYDVLRQCRSDAQALLSTHFDTGSLHVPGSPEEEEKQQLQHILLDASARRLQAQKIYLKAVAATRWVSTRATILQGQKPHAGHMGALQQAEINLRAELSTITDERVVNDLRVKDWGEDRWIAEDPSLPALQNWIPHLY